MKARLQEGFTLIELMIVVAAVAVLAAVAYPSYTSAVLKGKRAQARTAIMDLLQQQERYMTQYNSYAGFDTDTLGATTPSGVPFKTFSGDSPTNAAYYLSAKRCGALGWNECVQVTATPTFADPEVGTLWARSTGARNCDGTAGSDPAPAPKVCWP